MPILFWIAHWVAKKVLKMMKNRSFFDEFLMCFLYFLVYTVRFLKLRHVKMMKNRVFLIFAVFAYTIIYWYVKIGPKRTKKGGSMFFDPLSGDTADMSKKPKKWVFFDIYRIIYYTVYTNTSKSTFLYHNTRNAKFSCFWVLGVKNRFLRYGADMKIVKKPKKIVKN